MRCFLAGEWDDAIAELQAARELTEETGERHSLVVIHSVTSLIALHRGELRRAGRPPPRPSASLADSDPASAPHWVMWARALLLEAEGADREALATLAGAWDLCARSGFAIEYPVLGADLVRLALAAGEPARAEEAPPAGTPSSGGCLTRPPGGGWSPTANEGGIR
jgi:hypothetical protein